MDQALVDQIVYTVNDLMEEFFQYVFQQDPGKKVCNIFRMTLSQFSHCELSIYIYVQ